MLKHHLGRDVSTLVWLKVVLEKLRQERSGSCLGHAQLYNESEADGAGSAALSEEDHLENGNQAMEREA